MAGAVGGVAGIMAMESSGLYVNGLDKLQDQELGSTAKEIAQAYIDRYIADTQSNLTYEERNQLYPDPQGRGDTDRWQVQVRLDGENLVSPKNTQEYTLVRTYHRKTVYPVVSLIGPEDIWAPEENVEAVADRYMVQPPETYRNCQEKQVRDGLKVTTYYYYYCENNEPYQVRKPQSSAGGVN
jgi:hypothetical protein